MPCAFLEISSECIYKHVIALHVCWGDSERLLVLAQQVAGGFECDPVNWRLLLFELILEFASRICTSDMQTLMVVTLTESLSH